MSTKCTETVNHRKSFDLSLLSDSSSGDDILTNTANDFDASENCTLLEELIEKPTNDGILYRIARYANRHKRFRGEFGDDTNRNGKFSFASSRRIHKRTIKRYLFLFGVVWTLIIFSQLCLSVYNDEPDVEGLFFSFFFTIFQLHSSMIFIDIFVFIRLGSKSNASHSDICIAQCQYNDSTAKHIV